MASTCRRCAGSGLCARRPISRFRPPLDGDFGEGPPVCFQLGAAAREGLPAIDRNIDVLRHQFDRVAGPAGAARGGGVVSSASAQTRHVVEVDLHAKVDTIYEDTTYRLIVWSLETRALLCTGRLRNTASFAKLRMEYLHPQ